MAPPLNLFKTERRPQQMRRSQGEDRWVLPRLTSVKHRRGAVDLVITFNLDK